MATPIFDKFLGDMSALSQGICSSNLKFVSLAILEQLAFNAQKFTGVTGPWVRLLVEKFLWIMCRLSQRTCLPNLKFVALNVLVLDSDHHFHYTIDGPMFADPRLTAVSP